MYRGLAYVHPAWMLGAIVLTALALRAGLALRRARVRRARRRLPLLASHVRVARPAVVLALVGFVLGPISMWLLRGRAPFETAHAVIGVATAALLLATGVLGLRLHRGRSRAADLHGRLGLAAVLAAALSAIAGFVLLP